jgi:Helix-turn-helix domain
LFRYELIQDVIDPQLSARQRGKMVRELAQAIHTDPFGEPAQVSRQTIDRWIRAWRAGGFEALVPTPARVSARTPGEVLEVAVALKRETLSAPRRRSCGSCAPNPGGHPQSAPCNATSNAWNSIAICPLTRRWRSAGSKPTGATSCGSGMCCTAQ